MFHVLYPVFALIGGSVISLDRGFQPAVLPFRHSRSEQPAKISKINQDPPSTWLSAFSEGRKSDKGARFVVTSLMLQIPSRVPTKPVLLPLYSPLLIEFNYVSSKPNFYCELLWYIVNFLKSSEKISLAKSLLEFLI